MPPSSIVHSFEAGVGGALGHIAIIVALGTMLGKMMAESGDLGMMTLEQDLKRLYMQKRISLENGVVASNNKRRFQQIMNLAPMGGGD